jgi:hypothetical protein
MIRRLRIPVKDMASQELPDKTASISRRFFARSMAATTAFSLLPPATGTAEQAAPTHAANLGTRPEGLSVADWDEVHAKYSNLLRVYGERLSSEEKHRLASILTTNQHMLASIRTFEVQNGDASACILRVYDPKKKMSPAEPS